MVLGRYLLRDYLDPEGMWSRRIWICRVCSLLLEERGLKTLFEVTFGPPPACFVASREVDEALFHVTLWELPTSNESV